jgi:hypothetical protein
LRSSLAATAVALVGIGWLALTLPPDAFFSGDPGLKFIAAANAVEHPSTPFTINLPTIGGRGVPHVDPMIAVHGSHGHVLQSPVFPVLTAPLVAAFGIRGAYVLPALSFVLMVPLLEMLRRHTTSDTSFLVLAVMALAANPVLFYSLEFWEHAPAIVLLTGSTALSLRLRPDSGTTPGLASGAVAGLAVLLRPEAAWYLAGLFLAAGRRRRAGFACGVAVVLLPFSLASYAHSGSVFGPHISNSLSPLQSNWLTSRWQRLDAWLVPDSAAETAGLALMAAAWIAGWFGANLGVRQVVALAGAALISILASRHGVHPDSLWQAFPVALVALVPPAGAGDSRRGRLWLIAAVAALGVILTAAHDGGAQWGPRFLLIVTPVLIVLAAASATRLAGAGAVRTARIGLLAITLLAAIMTSRAAYRELRGAKRAYDRIIASTHSLTSPGDSLVTNVWWFDQVTAALYGTRTFLYAPNQAAATEILNELAMARQPQVTLVWTSEPDGAPLNTGDTCFQVVETREVMDRRLTFARARCDEGR